jgi:hypothetical protein
MRERSELDFNIGRREVVLIEESRELSVVKSINILTIGRLISERMLTVTHPQKSDWPACNSLKALAQALETLCNELKFEPLPDLNISHQYQYQGWQAAKTLI